MKKIICPLTIFAALIMTSCGNETQPAAASQPAPAKEVIIVKPEPTVIIKEKEAPAKPTTITLDKNGVQVQTKKIDVKVGQDN